MTISYHSGGRLQGKSTSYKVHTFTSTGNSTFQITAGSGDVEYLIVAGGGGGGARIGGGGGAGGLLQGTVAKSTSTGSSGSHTVTVGTGGAGGSSNNTGANGQGTNGVNSVFDTLTSIGGGGGGRYISPPNNGDDGSDGGSGGGAGGIIGSGVTGGSATSGQGYAGGTGASGASGAGGGGGAGAVGGTATAGNAAGAGGIGLQSSINGTATYYAGGGGGSADDNNASGGSGGGGNGGAGNSGASNYGGTIGTANTGGGGGGQRPDNVAGFDGGSGIVIIRYKTSSGITATGGDTITTISEEQTKPTNVPDGSRYEETDTRKIYTKLVSNLTHEDDFSSDNFTDVGSGVGVNTTNKTLGGAFPRGARTATYKAITELSDTSWVIRFKFNLTSHSGSPTGVYIGVTDTSNATDTTNTSRDAIMFWTYSDGGVKYAISHPTDTVFGLAYTDMTTTPSNGDVYYVELKRTSATAGTCSLYSDSGFSTLVEAKNFTIASGASNTGLDNILITNLSDGGSGGTTVATIEDLKIYNGVTSAKDGGWKEKGTT